MRFYEVTYILSPELPQEEKDNLATRLKNIIQKNGRLVKEEEWGKKRLAYPIKHKEYGTYVFMVFESDEATVTKIEQEMNLQADVLRYLSVKIEDNTPYIVKPETQEA